MQSRAADQRGGRPEGRIRTAMPALDAGPDRAAVTGRPRPLSSGQIREAAERYVRVFEAADPREQKLLIDAVTPSAADGQEEDPWGPAPLGAETSAAELSQLRMRFADRRRLIDTALTRHEVADLLGITARAVTDHLTRGDLVGFKQGRRWLLPAWQFDADVERGIVPGIAQLQRAVPGGIVSLTRWVTQPNTDLGNRSPRDTLVAGGLDRVLDVAAALTAAGW